MRDHGIGIALADQTRIFERFERVESGQAAGLGLGLWIVRQVTEALRGSVRVNSEPGQGTTFSVELPRTPPGHAHVGDQAAAAMVSASR